MQQYHACSYLKITCPVSQELSTYVPEASRYSAISIFLLFISAINSYYYISKGRINYDIKSNEYANVGVFFGILGIISGMLWAKFTWGTYWTNDPKLNGSALGLLIYFSYFAVSLKIEKSDTKKEATEERKKIPFRWRDLIDKKNQSLGLIDLGNHS